MTLLTSLLIAAGILVLGMATSWIDRKVTARVQARIGPPWFQPLADILKLLGKETLAPDGIAGTVFLTAPLVGFAGALAAAAIAGQALFRPEQGFAGDVIVLAYLLVTPAIALIIGAGASGNTMAGVGASREIKLILGYELPWLIVLATVIYRAGFDLRLGSIILAQQTAGPFIGSVSGIICFVVLVLTTQAKLGLVPFDVPEAEQEIMAGIITENSGPPLAVIKLTKMLLGALMPLVVVMLLMGGFGAGTGGIIGGIAGYLVVVVLAVLIRNTNPRVRIDQAVRFFWGPVTLLALAGLGAAVMGW